MTEKPINPWLKQGLELGPTVAFFILYTRIKDQTFTLGGTDYSGFIVATLVFVPILLAAMAALWVLTHRLSRMQVFTALMVIFFGALTAYFNDERFFKMKTTLVYGVMAGLLGIGLLRGQSWLEALIGEMMPMRRDGWMILTRRMVILLGGLAVVNELIWRNFSTETWVAIETFGFPILLIVGMTAQVVALQSHMIDEDAADGDPGREND